MKGRNLHKIKASVIVDDLLAGKEMPEGGIKCSPNTIFPLVNAIRAEVVERTREKKRAYIEHNSGRIISIKIVDVKPAIKNNLI